MYFIVAFSSDYQVFAILLGFLHFYKKGVNFIVNILAVFEVIKHLLAHALPVHVTLPD